MLLFGPSTVIKHLTLVLLLLSIITHETNASKSNCIDKVKGKCNRAKVESEPVPQVLLKNGSEGAAVKLVKRRFSHKHVQENQDYQSSIIGKEVVIECKIKNYTNDEKIVWLRMPKGDVLTLDGSKVTQDRRFYSKCLSNVSPCWALVIDNPTESDSGYYVCQTNQMFTKYTYLDILVPPRLLDRTKEDRIDIEQNNFANLNCDVYGQPRPSIYWYKYESNNNPVELVNFRNQTKVTYQIDNEITNKIECVADNNVPPTVSKTFSLNIKFLPKVSFSNSQVYQSRNRAVIFDCVVQSNPEPQMSWLRNGVSLEDSSKHSIREFKDSRGYNYRLHIKSLNENDFGDYFCSASNSVGTVMNKIELIELGVPSTILNSMFTKTSSSTKSNLKTTEASDNNSISSTNLTDELIYSVHSDDVDSKEAAKEDKSFDKSNELTNSFTYDESSLSHSSSSTIKSFTSASTSSSQLPKKHSNHEHKKKQKGKHININSNSSNSNHQNYRKNQSYILNHNNEYAENLRKISTNGRNLLKEQGQAIVMKSETESSKQPSTGCEASINLTLILVSSLVTIWSNLR